MYTQNLFIQLASNAVKLIAVCDQALADDRQADKLFWIDTKSKAFGLFSDAMKNLGMTTKIHHKLIQMTHDDVARYLNHRFNCLLYSKTRNRNAANK